jgi:hypothetical protein
MVRVKGQKPEPRVYRDSDGRMYGVEKLPAPGSSAPISLNANTLGEGQHPTKAMLKAVLDVSSPPRPPLPGPTPPDITSWFLGGGPQTEASSPAVKKLFVGDTATALASLAEAMEALLGDG